MPFTYRDKPKLSDRFRGKSGEELLNELASDLDPQTRMFFDPPPSWRQRHGNPSRFLRAFPFADDRKRTDIRAYLDEIAARHPEFADQLREPSWDEDFNRSPLGRHSTGVEPEGEVNSSQLPGPSNQNPEAEPEVGKPRQNLSNFGLRNTVPLGPGAVVGDNRQQRSMSAPPDHRTVEKPKKFVTKCEIPIMHDPAQESAGSKSEPSGKGSQENVQSKMNNAPNVRVIPIQVEGRDVPLLNTNFDTSMNYPPDSFEGRLPRDFGAYQRHSPRFAHKERSATPPHHQYAPHFQQYAAPHQHFGPGLGQHQSVPQKQFVPPQQQHQPRQPFQHQQSQKPQQYQQPRPYPPQNYQQYQHYPYPQQQQYCQPQPHPQQYQPHPQNQQHQPHPQQQQQQQQHQQPYPQAPPGAQKSGHEDETDSKPPQAPQPKTEPIKDPIEKVQVIQKEVEELMKQVESFNGNSRSDKQYLLLDELLTRQLLLLDNIDTEGKENVRQARKDTIRSIQRCISTLENKVPLVESQEELGAVKMGDGENGEKGVQGDNAPQAMEVDQTKESTPIESKESQSMDVDGQEGDKTVKESSDKVPGGESEGKVQ